MTASTYTTMHSVPAFARYVAGSDHNRPNDKALWSGDIDPPAVGSTIIVKMNGIGEARVTGYFVEGGWLGVLCQPLSPPAWFVKQNGADSLCHAFGIEIDTIAAQAARKAARIAAKVAAHAPKINELVRRAEFLKLMAKLYAKGVAGDKSWTCAVAENVLDTIDENGNTANPTYADLRSWFCCGYDNPRDDRKAAAIVAKFEARFPA